jgi:peptidoglycan hydrolase-like protein with peptidoglycan-binding domain
VAFLALGSATVPVADAAAANQTFGKRPLKIGMRGRDVRVLQDFLTRAGFDTTVDGQFGRGTARRVRSWERHARRKVDGRVSRPDARVLRTTVETSSAVAPTAPVAPRTGKAVVGADGLATAPADAPPLVQAIIAAGNRIATKPYKYGGGHGKWEDTGYDCSGAVSYALHGGGFLNKPLDSSGFESWGQAGPGTWITVYANSGHAYTIIAGLRFDTSAAGSGGDGPRWRTKARSSSGYVVRHPPGF